MVQIWQIADCVSRSNCPQYLENFEPHDPMGAFLDAAMGNRIPIRENEFDVMSFHSDFKCYNKIQVD